MAKGGGNKRAKKMKEPVEESEEEEVFDLGLEENEVRFILLAYDVFVYWFYHRNKPHTVCPHILSLYYFRVMKMTMKMVLMVAMRTMIMRIMRKKKLWKMMKMTRTMGQRTRRKMS